MVRRNGFPFFPAPDSPLGGVYRCLAYHRTHTRNKPMLTYTPPIPTAINLTLHMPTSRANLAPGPLCHPRYPENAPRRDHIPQKPHLRLFR